MNIDTTTPNRRLLTPLDLFQYWYQCKLNRNFRGYRVKGLGFKASYDNGDESGEGIFGGGQNEYYEAVNQLVVWTLRGYCGLTLSLIARVKKIPGAVQGRLVRVPDLRMKLGTQGHPAARIRRQWTCKREDCERSGLTYWCGVKDLPKYHVPLRSIHIRSWSADIAEGKATPQRPGPALIQRMIRNQQARKTAIAPTPAAQELNMNFYGMASTWQQIIQVDGLNLYLSFYGPEYNGGHPQGKLHLPDSPFSCLEGLEQFKAWCLGHPSWVGERSKAEAMIDMLEDHGYNVELIAYLDAEDWICVACVRNIVSR